MRFWLVIIGILAVGLTVYVALGYHGAPAVHGDDAPRAGPTRTPVLVELFTSEGCSSCPPADAFLIRLHEQQPVASAYVVILEWHVDYWDRLGWRDPFSSPDSTARQQVYANSFGVDSVYTPQMVVDGSQGFVGSRESQALKVIARAAQQRKSRLELSWTRDAAETTTQLLSVRAPGIPGVAAGDLAEVFLAVTEDNLRTDVARGENAGRALVHGGVVRQVQLLGRARAGAVFEAKIPVKLAGGWKRPDLRAVVFVQERQSRRILAAASLPF